MLFRRVGGGGGGGGGGGNGTFPDGANGGIDGARTYVDKRLGAFWANEF